MSDSGPTTTTVWDGCCFQGCLEEPGDESKDGWRSK